MNKARRKFYLFAYMARWSSGQDAALSRRKHGFDSRTDCYTECIVSNNAGILEKERVPALFL